MKTVTTGVQGKDSHNKASQTFRNSGLLSYKSLLLASCLSLPLAAGMQPTAQAAGGYFNIALTFAAATSATLVGDTVTNPTTGADETVVALVNDADGQVIYAVTSTGILLFTKTTVGDTYRSTDPADPKIYQVVEATLNGTTGLVESVKVNLSTDVGASPAVTPTVTNIVLDESSGFDTIPADKIGDPAGSEFIAAPSGSGPINENSKGAKGAGGSDAYGLEICIPLIGCATIAKLGSNGKDGKKGPTVNRTVSTSHGGITATGSGEDGIKITSTGGKGGTGGDSYGNITAYRGGDGGNGGNITLNNYTTVETTTNSANGITVVSRSGKGGLGGDGILFAASGSGGNARSGGTVTIDNKQTGSILTDGVNSHGIYGLSVGGAGGSGGSGWGIVGKGGSGAAGGSGGQVFITNDALIHTKQRGSHGILGQSIGGTGGNGGDAGGIVAFGGGSSTGGPGSNVTITHKSNGNIITDGTYSIGIFGQSVGGSGGDGGAAGGIVAFGAVPAPAIRPALSELPLIVAARLPPMVTFPRGFLLRVSAAAAAPPRPQAALSPWAAAADRAATAPRSISPITLLSRPRANIPTACSARALAAAAVRRSARAA